MDVVGDGAGVVDGSLVDGAGVDGWMENVTADGSAVVVCVWMEMWCRCVFFRTLFLPSSSKVLFVVLNGCTVSRRTRQMGG